MLLQVYSTCIIYNKVVSKIVFSDEMENFELFLFIETFLKDLLRSYLAYELIKFNRMDTFAVAQHRLSSVSSIFVIVPTHII